MARSKQAAGYPAAYYDLIEGVTEKGEAFTLQCTDNKKAQLMRFQFYDFIKACRKSHNKREQAIGEAAYGLVFSVKGNCLTISPRDSEEDAINLRNALDAYLQRDPEHIAAKTMTERFVRAGSTPPPLKAPDDLEHFPSHDDMIQSFLNKKEKE